MRRHQGRVVQHVPRRDVPARVALRTIPLTVLSFKGKSRLRVIERRRFEPDKGETTSMMFLVAFDTLPPRQRRMIPPSGRHARAEFLMTGEAIVIRHHFAQRVATGAMRHPFQRCMGRGEFARRDLRESRLRSCEEGNNGRIPQQTLPWPSRYHIQVYPNATATPT